VLLWQGPLLLIDAFATLSSGPPRPFGPSSKTLLRDTLHVSEPAEPDLPMFVVDTAWGVVFFVVWGLGGGGEVCFFFSFLVFFGGMDVGGRYSFFFFFIFFFFLLSALLFFNNEFGHFFSFPPLAPHNYLYP